MSQRANTTPRPKVPGRCGDPVDGRDHFLECPTCGHMIDMRDLAEVLEHAGPHEAPSKCQVRLP
jgi:hypothetical protein